MADDEKHCPLILFRGTISSDVFDACVCCCVLKDEIKRLHFKLWNKQSINPFTKFTFSSHHYTLAYAAFTSCGMEDSDGKDSYLWPAKCLCHKMYDFRVGWDCDQNIITSIN